MEIRLKQHDIEKAIQAYMVSMGLPEPEGDMTFTQGKTKKDGITVEMTIGEGGRTVASAPAEKAQKEDAPASASKPKPKPKAAPKAEPAPEPVTEPESTQEAVAEKPEELDEAAPWNDKEEAANDDQIPVTAPVTGKKSLFGG